MEADFEGQGLGWKELELPQHPESMHANFEEQGLSSGMEWSYALRKEFNLPRGKNLTFK